VTVVDWLAVTFILLLAFGGARKGLIVGGLSLVGVVGGLYLGGRLAPVLLSGSESPYTPLIALAGALLLAIALEALGALMGGAVRDAIRLTPLRMVDAAGGMVLGVATAIAVLWILAAVALHLPQASSLRTQARESALLSGLIEALPPQDVMSALADIDPVPLITGPAAPSQPPDESILGRARLHWAEPSVVRVHSQACGIGYAGSGWVVSSEPELVVTAAHVVAGGRDISVQARDQSEMDALVVAFDGRNDLALLRVPGLELKPLPLARPGKGDSVAVLGPSAPRRLESAPLQRSSHPTTRAGSSVARSRACAGRYDRATPEGLWSTAKARSSSRSSEPARAAKSDTALRVSS
jgi:uncharacterized membrane protein required for colicin V production